MPSRRTQMCSKKVSFRSRGKAEAIALQFGQRVYECPICFCWHCTNKADWRNEYIDEDEVKRRMADLERRLRTEYNERLRKKNSRILELERENKNLRRGYNDSTDEKSNPGGLS